MMQSCSNGHGVILYDDRALGPIVDTRDDRPGCPLCAALSNAGPVFTSPQLQAMTERAEAAERELSDIRDDIEVLAGCHGSGR